MRLNLDTRAWRTLAASLLLIAIVIIAGRLILVFSAPEAAARVLGRVLGRAVQIDALRIAPGFAFEIELAGIRVLPVAPGEASEVAPLFEAVSARGRQSWARLLAGQLIPLEWTLEEPVLRIPVGNTEEGAEAPASGLRPRFPLNRLIIRGGRVVWQPAEGEKLQLMNLEGEFRRAGLPTGVTGEARGQIMRGEVQIGELQLSLAGSADAPELIALLQDLDLAGFPIGGQAISAGRVSGTASIASWKGGLRGSSALRVVDLEHLPPGLRQPLSPENLDLSFAWSWTDGVLRIQPKGLRLDDLTFSGDLTFSPERGVKGWLSLAPFELGRPDGRLQLLRLMGLRFATFQRMDQRVEGGRVEAFRMEIDVRPGELLDSLAFRRKPTPAELSLSLRLEDVVYRPHPGSVPLENISATLRLQGNSMHVEALRMERGGGPLPEVHLSLEGMHRLVRLPLEERGVPRGPGVPIPGLPPGFSSLGSSSEDLPPPRFRLHDFYLAYPAFVLPFRNIEGWLQVAPGGGIILEGAEGVLGGAPARVDVTWSSPKHRIDVAVHYLDGEPLQARRERQPGEWAAGRMTTPSLQLGAWRIDEVDAQLRAVGDRIALEEVRAKLGEGPLVCSGEVDLGQEGHAPYQVRIDLKGAEASLLAPFVGLEEERISGRVTLRGTIAARLEPGRTHVETASSQFDLRLESGFVRDLPISMALARLPSGLGLRGLFGRPLPYGVIQAGLALEDGRLRFEEFTLDGPELRMTGAGEMDLRTPEQNTEVVLALLFLRTVDLVIDQLPILRDLILGENRSLITLYVEIKGPRDDLTARPIPPEAIQRATSWTTGVIAGGVAQLRKLFGLGRSERSRKDDAGETKDQ